MQTTDFALGSSFQEINFFHAVPPEVSPVPYQHKNNMAVYLLNENEKWQKKVLLFFCPPLSKQSNQRYKGDLSPRGYGPSSPTHKLPASYAGDKWGSEMLSRNSTQDAKERTCVSCSVSHAGVPWVWVLWRPDLPKGLPCTLQ